ncbi:MAG: NYN domain-containing protein [Pseudonocardiaceae bacterium]
MALMLTNVYVDGFNLYYGCLKGTPYKWLDLGALFQVLLLSNKIQRIRYFTAKVNGQTDPQQPVRQDTYLRALQTVPGLSVHLGHFLTSTVRMPLANPVPAGARTVEVIKTEERALTSTWRHTCWLTPSGQTRTPSSWSATTRT